MLGGGGGGCIPCPCIWWPGKPCGGGLVGGLGVKFPIVPLPPGGGGGAIGLPPGGIGLGPFPIGGGGGGNEPGAGGGGPLGGFGSPWGGGGGGGAGAWGGGGKGLGGAPGAAAPLAAVGGGGLFTSSGLVLKYTCNCILIIARKNSKILSTRFFKNKLVHLCKISNY